MAGRLASLGSAFVFGRFRKRIVSTKLLILPPPALDGSKKRQRYDAYSKSYDLSLATWARTTHCVRGDPRAAQGIPREIPRVGAPPPVPTGLEQQRTVYRGIPRWCPLGSAVGSPRGSLAAGIIPCRGGSPMRIPQGDPLGDPPRGDPDPSGGSPQARLGASPGRSNARRGDPLGSPSGGSPRGSPQGVPWGIHRGIPPVDPPVVVGRYL